MLKIRFDNAIIPKRLASALILSASTAKKDQAFLNFEKELVSDFQRSIRGRG